MEQNIPDSATSIYRSVAAACSCVWLYLFGYAWQQHANWTGRHFVVLSLLCAVAALCALLAHRRTQMQAATVSAYAGRLP